MTKLPRWAFEFPFQQRLSIVYQVYSISRLVRSFKRITLHILAESIEPLAKTFPPDFIGTHIKCVFTTHRCTRVYTHAHAHSHSPAPSNLSRATPLLKHAGCGATSEQALFPQVPCVHQGLKLQGQGWALEAECPYFSFVAQRLFLPA